jgi:hypothetical protein
VDTDELMLPMTHHELTFENFNTTLNIRLKDKIIIRNASGLKQNMNELLDKFSTYSNGRTVMLPYSCFIKNKYIDSFCLKFENTTISNETKMLYFNESFATEKYDEILQIKINLTDKSEYEYAVRLCQLNENVVKPALKSLPKKLNEADYNRFYSVDRFFGKSVHQTSDILTIGTHASWVKYEIKNGTNSTLVSKITGNYIENCGFTAHFRPNQLTYGLRSIKDIVFDSYFFNIVQQAQID